MAAELGYLDLAYDYLVEAALLDLDDIEHNTRDGLHMAALAGTWMALVAGLGGMRTLGSRLSFAPRLAPCLTRLCFRVRHRGARLKVDVTASKATYSLVRDGAELERAAPQTSQARLSSDGTSLCLLHHGEQLEVTVGEPVTRDIPPPPRRDHEPAQPAGRAPRRQTSAGR
jgi:alpha,alpha-trehalose phosphorylase